MVGVGGGGGISPEVYFFFFHTACKLLMQNESYTMFDT